MDYLKGSLTFVPKNGQEKEIKYVPEKKALIDIGSDLACDIRIRGDVIEGIHCKIYREADGKVKLHNLSESNPTLLNDEIVRLKQQLKSGDVVTVGNVKLRWELDADAKRRLTMMSKEDRKIYKNKIIKTKKRVTMHNFRINTIIKSNSASSEESPSSDDGENKKKNDSTDRKIEEAESVDPQENNEINAAIKESPENVVDPPLVITEKENEKAPSKANTLNLSGVLQTSYTPSSKVATRSVSKTPYNTPMRSPLVKSSAKSILNESVNVLPSSTKKPAKSMHLIDLTTPLVKRTDTSTPKTSTLRNTPKTAGKTPLRNAILLKSALKNSSIKKAVVQQNVSNIALKGKVLFESPATDSSSVIEVSLSSIEVIDSSNASISAKSFDVQSSDKKDAVENILESSSSQKQETVPTSQSSDEVKELLDNISSVLGETENGNENINKESEKEMTSSKEIEESFNKIVEQQNVMEDETNESLFEKKLSFATSKAVDNFDKFMSDENIIEQSTKDVVDECPNKTERDPEKKAEDLLKRIEIARESLSTEPNKTTQILSTRYSNVTPNDSIVESVSDKSSPKYDAATPKLSILDTVASLRKSEISSKLSMSPVSKMSVANDSTEIVENYELNSNIPKSLRSTRKRIGTAMASLHNISQSADTSFNVNESLNASINKDLTDANQSLAEMSNILSLDDQPLESSNKENECEDLAANKSTLIYEYSGREENNGENRVIFEINNDNDEIGDDEEINSSSDSDSEESDIEEQQEVTDSDEDLNEPVCESPLAKKFRLSEQDLEEEGINPLEISKGDDQLEMEDSAIESTSKIELGHLELGSIIKSMDSDESPAKVLDTYDKHDNDVNFENAESDGACDVQNELENIDCEREIVKKEMSVLPMEVEKPISSRKTMISDGDLINKSFEEVVEAKKLESQVQNVPSMSPEKESESKEDPIESSEKIPEDVTTESVQEPIPESNETAENLQIDEHASTNIDEQIDEIAESNGTHENIQKDIEVQSEEISLEIQNESKQSEDIIEVSNEEPESNQVNEENRREATIEPENSTATTQIEESTNENVPSENVHQIDIGASINTHLIDAGQSLAEMSNILSLDDQSLESCNKENEFEEVAANKSTLIYECSGEEENNGENRAVFEINNENDEIGDDEVINSSSESNPNESHIEEQQEVHKIDSDEIINKSIVDNNSTLQESKESLKSLDTDVSATINELIKVPTEVLTEIASVQNYSTSEVLNDTVDIPAGQNTLDDTKISENRTDEDSAIESTCKTDQSNEEEKQVNDSALESLQMSPIKHRESTLFSDTELSQLELGSIIKSMDSDESPTKVLETEDKHDNDENFENTESDGANEANDVQKKLENIDCEREIVKKGMSVLPMEVEKPISSCKTMISDGDLINKSFEEVVEAKKLESQVENVPSMSPEKESESKEVPIESSEKIPEDVTTESVQEPIPESNETAENLQIDEHASTNIDEQIDEIAESNGTHENIQKDIEVQSEEISLEIQNESKQSEDIIEISNEEPESNQVNEENRIEATIEPENSTPTTQIEESTNENVPSENVHQIDIAPKSTENIIEPQTPSRRRAKKLNYHELASGSPARTPRRLRAASTEEKSVENTKSSTKPELPSTIPEEKKSEIASDSTEKISQSKEDEKSQSAEVKPKSSGRARKIDKVEELKSNNEDVPTLSKRAKRGVTPIKPPIVVTEPEKKERRGRPEKIKEVDKPIKEVESVAKISEAITISSTEEEAPKLIAKRGRGRQAKIVEPINNEEEHVEVQESPVKKGRGRQAKVVEPTNDKEEPVEVQESPVKKGRGRKLKDGQELKESVEEKLPEKVETSPKHGRGRKIDKVEELKSNTEDVPTPSKRAKRGITPIQPPIVVTKPEKKGRRGRQEKVEEVESEAKINEAISISSTEEEAPKLVAKRGRGRQAKVVEPINNEEEPVEVQETSVKKGRGRKLKDGQELQENVEEKLPEKVETSPKRGRGRKIDKVEELKSNTEDVPTPSKRAKRGITPIQPPIVVAKPEKKERRGRPEKVQEVENPTEEVESVAKISEAITISSTEEEAPKLVAKRGRGRQAKVVEPINNEVEHVEVQESPVKKGRGRQAKVVEPINNEEEHVKMQETPVKKGRGRQAKVVEPINNKEEHVKVQETPVKKGRGRQAKVVEPINNEEEHVEVQESPVKKGRGRKLKDEQELKEKMEEKLPEKVETSPKRGRGRKVNFASETPTTSSRTSPVHTRNKSTRTRK